MRKSQLAGTLLTTAIVLATNGCAVKDVPGQAQTVTAIPFGAAATETEPPPTSRGDYQPGLSSLTGRLQAGNRVRVTLGDSRVDGTVVELRDDRMTIMTDGKPRILWCAQIERVELRGDALWNGAIIGAAIIAVPAWNGCQNQGRNLTCVTIGVGTFAALGAIMDRAHQGTKTVYVASSGSCATARGSHNKVEIGYTDRHPVE